MIIQFEKSDSSTLHPVFGVAGFPNHLKEISEQLDGIDIDALENNQTYREIIALKSVLVKANELAAKINKSYLENNPQIK